jgi:hypothetical protein
MPFVPDAPFDPSEWQRLHALPRIVVHPKPPPNAPAPDLALPDGVDDWYVPDGPDDWFVPGTARTDASYPNDWFVPTWPAAPGMAPSRSSQQPSAANAGFFNPPTAPIANPAAPPPDPFAAYWSQIPASRVGAMAWDPPNLPLFAPIPTNNFAAPTSRSAFQPGSWPPLSTDSSPWSPTRSPPSPVIPQGGLLGKLATLGLPPAIPSGGGILGALATLGTPAMPTWPQGGLLGGLAGLGSESPGPAGLLPSPQQPQAQPQSATAPAASPNERRPIGDYSTGEIAGDAAKSIGVGTGEGVIHLAGLPGDVREMLANGAQRGVDYLAPGYMRQMPARRSRRL